MGYLVNCLIDSLIDGLIDWLISVTDNIDLLTISHVVRNEVSEAKNDEKQTNAPQEK